MRAVHPFNYDWLYTPQQVGDDTPDSDFESVILPHTNIELPWHNFKDSEYQFISTYRKRFTLPEPLEGRRLYIDFEGVMTAATVSINGHTFEEHKGGFVPFSYDITEYVHEDGDNLLTVSVDSRERDDIPPHGGQVDYLVFGGIYRDVSLRYMETLHIANMKVSTFDVLTENPRVELTIWVRNVAEQEQDARLQATIQEGDRVSFGLENAFAEAHTELRLPPQSETRVRMELTFDRGREWRLWSLDDPYLYRCGVMLRINGGKIGALGTFPFGMREAVFKDDGFYLNGKRIFLRGLNRHQMYPFIGAAAPARLQRRDAEIIKELGCNIVRTSHYPQDISFLDRCDEIGLLVLEEIPGWQHIGDEAWQQISLRDVRAMIERDWNHPSIVLWGVRINESWDNTVFYTKTNALARELDPTRQTTGIRFWPHSEFLEDVYGYNDFTNGVIEPTHTPWIITEFNGHMFPTKTWDNEDRQTEHLRRHAYIQALASSTGGVSGAIGWCAFDYNTHSDFGSGDRICYHGVMDMWRQPKWAATVYRSQKSPDEEIVLEAATFWTRGDRSTGINDPLYVLTNCDYIAVYVGDAAQGKFYPAYETFPGLTHPPIVLGQFGDHWGDAFRDLHIVGYRGEQAVAEQRISADGVPQQLVAFAEDTEIHADGRDMTRIVFKITDEYGNRLPYAIQPVTLELLEGDAQLIGENPFTLVGGQAALFLKAGHTPGTARIRVSTPRLESVEVKVGLKT